MSTETGIYKHYDLTAEEIRQATVFTTLQLQYLQTALYLCVHDKVTTAYDPESKDGMQRFIMEQEYNRGCIATLETIINTHLNTIASMIQENTPDLILNPNFSE